MLGGLTVRVGDTDPPYRVAAQLLGRLGAVVGDAGECRLGEGGGPGARMVRWPGPAPEAGLPAGTLELAGGLALALASIAGWRQGCRVDVSELAVAIEVWLPEVMAASYSSPPVMRPRPPVPADGGGWLHLDLGAPGDAEDYQRLLETLDPAATARDVAVAAQEWRLPVCDYRPRRPRPGPPVTFSAREGAGARRAGTLSVCDLTTMWAGPLATRLLQDLGASIHKIEPAFRPDGMRATAGGGIHPGGRQVDPGRDSGMWNALNTGKRHLDLDLRRAGDIERFIALASDSDVVIDSFSPRVMPNFGLPERLAGVPITVSVPAFGPGPQRNWVAYGTGVHACSGLGEARDGTFSAPGVSYPDPIAGFTAALAVMAAAVGRDRGLGPVRAEASLDAALQPLVAGGGAGVEGPGDPEVGAWLLEQGTALGLMEPRPVAGLSLLHPKGPFRVA